MTPTKTQILNEAWQTTQHIAADDARGRRVFRLVDRGPVQLGGYWLESVDRSVKCHSLHVAQVEIVDAPDE